MGREREESDQLPEEAPAEQVTDDDGEGEDGRQDVKHTPGVPGEDERGTGAPQDHD